MKLGILKTGRKEPKKKYTHHTCSAAMYFDAPYDYGLFPHDQQITVNNLTLMSKQFDAINTQSSHVWIVMHKPTDSTIVKEAMEERGYKNLSHVFWQKENHYVEGHPSKMTPVVEMGTLGCIPDNASIQTNMSKDPRKRPNCITLPSVLALAKDTADNEINVTEKPPGLAEWLFTSFCPKGSTVLIVGTGAGGCLKGAVLAGMNVVGVENDEKQFNQLQSEMHAWVANLGKEKKKSHKKQVKAAIDAKTSPQKGIKVDASAPPGEKQDASVAGLCFACDEKEKEGDPFDECAHCGETFHTFGCMEELGLLEDDESLRGGRICGACKNPNPMEALGNANDNVD